MENFSAYFSIFLTLLGGEYKPYILLTKRLPFSTTTIMNLTSIANAEWCVTPTHLNNSIIAVEVVLPLQMKGGYRRDQDKGGGSRIFQLERLWSFQMLPLLKMAHLHPVSAIYVCRWKRYDSPSDTNC